MGQGQEREGDTFSMRWDNYIGLMFVGMFLLFFGGGIFVGMDERAGIIPVLVILAFTGGFILLNTH
jgi:hypothetical protein